MNEIIDELYAYAYIYFCEKFPDYCPDLVFYAILNEE